MRERNVEKYILKKINDNPQEVIDLTLKELSGKWYVGQTSILRVVEKLKYKSYRDLQMQSYLKVKLDTMSKVENEIDINDHHSCAENIFNKCFSALLNTQALFDLEAMLVFKKILKSKSQICFFGVGNSYAIANMLSMALYKIGFNARCFSSTKEIIIALHYLDLKNLIFIFYSNSGNTKEVVYIAEQLNLLNCQFALITSNKSAYKSNAFKESVYTFVYEVNANEEVAFPQVSQQFCQIVFNNLLTNLLLMDLPNYHNINLQVTAALKKYNNEN